MIFGSFRLSKISLIFIYIFFKIPVFSLSDDLTGWLWVKEKLRKTLYIALFIKSAFS